MRVLCAVGQRGGPELVQRLAEILSAGTELLILHVVDTGLALVPPIPQAESKAERES